MGTFISKQGRKTAQVTIQTISQSTTLPTLCRNTFTMQGDDQENDENDLERKNKTSKTMCT